MFFTGSYATGRKIAEAAARQLMKVQLELGGKDPVYVADDVDAVAAAKATADGAFYNTGQSCCSVERLYVHERIHDAFVEAFVAEVQGFAVGDPMDEKTYIGPVAREVHLRVLEEQVADAKAKGGTLRLGGARLDRPGFYFAPTVFTDARPRDGAHARGDVRPAHRDPEGPGRRRGPAPHERHRIRPHRRRLHRATSRARDGCWPG